MRAPALLLCLAAALCADETQVRELVAQLGADEPEAREIADAELRKLGEADAEGLVDRLLEEGSASTDAEVATRCRAILDTLRYWERIVVVGGPKTGGIDVQSGKFAWSRPRGWCQAWSGERRRGARAWVFDRDGGLECVDLRSGARTWRSKAPGWGQAVGGTYWLGYSGKPATTLPLADGTYWLGYASNHVVRLSLVDGSTTWDVELPQPIHHVRPASVAADEHGVYVETAEYLIALDAKTGNERWRTNASLLGLARGALYVRSAEPGGPQGVQRLDPDTGKPLWSHAGPGGRPAQTLLDCGEKQDLVLIANDQGHTCAVEATTGKDRWTFAAQPTSVWVEPDGAHGWLAAEGALIVLDLANGNEVARFPRECEAARFLYDDGALYVADYETISCDIALRAFVVATRKLTWTADVEGVQVSHSKYWQNARIERLGDRLLFVGESAGGSWIEVVEPSTGQVVARHRP